MRRGAIAAAACLGVTFATTAGPAGAAGPGLTHYAVHAHSVVTQNFEAADSPCGTPGTVTFDEHLNATIAATRSGLSDDAVLALLQDDPDGVVRQLTATTSGTAVLATGGHTYSGTFTMWFGGRFLPNGMYIQSGTFSLRARSEIGTLLHITSGGHDVDDFDGTTKMFNQHGRVTGCLP
jgi:hypothetical protein